VVGLEASPTKRDLLAEEFGIDVVDSTDFATARLPTACGRGADVVVDLLGTEASLAWAISAVRERGRVAALTTFLGVAAPVASRALVFREVSVLGSRYASRGEVALAAELVAQEAITPVVSRRVTLDGIDALHRDLEAGAVVGRGALVWEHDGGQ
jgi:propanol-preferring alcohol dehydrogenase